MRLNVSKNSFESETEVNLLELGFPNSAHSAAPGLLHTLNSGRL